MNTPESDDVLVGRYVDGDAAAFDQLYKRYELRVWRYLERNLRDQATSDELLQEVWCALARNAASLEGKTRFKNRLFSLVHDRMTVSLQSQPAPVDSPPVAGETTAADPTAALAQAVGQLPRDQREVFLLQMEGELSVGEIAEITEISIDSAQNKLRLAKLQVRELLSETT